MRDTPNDLGSQYNWMKVSSIDQAHYLARAYLKAGGEWSWMGPITAWNLDFARLSTGQQPAALVQFDRR